MSDPELSPAAADTAEPDITITHSAAEGTILAGLSKPETRKGGPVRAILDAQAWTWRPSPGWFQRQSHDRPARMGRIHDTANRLRALGYEVDVSIDESPRVMIEQEAERAEHMQARAEKLDGRAAQLHTEGAARQEQAGRFFASIPLGQPLMPDHHSYPADRNRRDRERDRLRRGMETEAAGDRAAAKAGSAAGHMDKRYAPQAVTNRIARLEAEASKLRLYLDEGDYEGAVPRGRGQPDQVVRSPITDPQRRARIETQLVDVQQQLAHWRGVRQQQIAGGAARRDYGPDDVAGGDYVRVRGRWRRVVRVNRKSLSVETGYSWTDRVPYREVTAVRRPEASDSAGQSAEAT
jgi:hypothetical protein